MRRTINNLPENLDMLIKKEAKKNGCTVNSLYLEIIQNHCYQYLDKEFSFNPYSGMNQILLKILNNQIEILELLKQQQDFISIFESLQEE
ncbi:hypothetical protein [Staphylococcus caprae]|uniref:hypothetical protein n=1 Tax=Staphylococcus caprae TaxID=29380 RepID=UPI000CD07EC7|nr:hypothetical protein [Staphylococcus caprae]POA06093.1 hypothetical protein CD155_03875 [Staphylococcus caprae]SUL89816.1 Uncharacterised protein [Staphylococcus caprae]